MSKVNQLLEKAISTSSEEEAVSCLRMARKHHKGGSVSVSANSASDGKSAQYWKEQAHRYFNLAQERDALALRLAREHAEYLGRYNTALVENSKLRREVSTAETASIFYKVLIFSLSIMLVTAVIL